MMDDILKQIKAGTSMPRNMFLFNNAIYLLPYGKATQLCPFWPRRIIPFG